MTGCDHERVGNVDYRLPPIVGLERASLAIASGRAAGTSRPETPGMAWELGVGCRSPLNRKVMAEASGYPELAHATREKLKLTHSLPLLAKLLRGNTWHCRCKALSDIYPGTALRRAGGTAGKRRRRRRRPGPAAPPAFGSGSARPGAEDVPSPRVILSERRPLAPPPLFGIGEAAAAAAAAAGTARSKRHPQGGRVHRGEYSVCDSESRWVTDKPSAFDITGTDVRVLLEFSTAGRPVRQYFYETRCKGGGAGQFGSSCRGIDERHWDSRCKTTQSYVRALTLDKSGQSVWTWIRIDTACVCTLTRKFGRY
ncbi:LOW QUALITY PROTEIN: neurotrophin-4-like [Lampetra planeri]